MLHDGPAPADARGKKKKKGKRKNSGRILRLVRNVAEKVRRIRYRVGEWQAEEGLTRCLDIRLEDPMTAIHLFDRLFPCSPPPLPLSCRNDGLLAWSCRIDAHAAASRNSRTAFYHQQGQRLEGLQGLVLC